ncbi:unnamed protein product [Kuraishia capsulata CBS 1993]|uniref:Peptide-methionine (R)-S-oxide reductase n=1 Tax=Kuraishia capsulata CBS 1993 TaxID=1382522 RepID=W6MY25_9ASCO|nr:uncharacterized protein KUCA_T00005889001 [Kuraishia capsulata CBS 1993]CDK29895.1 unnamed protein product [Kuraishia capsulata CBS 1993]
MLSKCTTRFTPRFIRSALFSTYPHIMSDYPVTKPDSEWRATLTPMQYKVLRNAATEPPNFDPEFDKKGLSPGVYKCVGCGNPLYKSSTKFNSHCGWPAFYQALPGSVTTKTDTSHGMERTEMNCSKCGGHLGHVFKGEGYATPTDERHCVNGVILKFEPDTM